MSTRGGPRLAASDWAIAVANAVELPVVLDADRGTHRSLGGGLAQSAAEARSLAGSIGPPVALKASSPDLLHKTEAGVIRLGLKTPEAVESAFEEIVAQTKNWNPQARLDGVLVEEMIDGETREVIVGARQDLRFGPVVTFGLGGIFVEAIRDFVVWPAPLTLDEAREMIRKIRGYRILTAFRGRPAGDLEAVAQVIYCIGQLACLLAAASYGVGYVYQRRFITGRGLSPLALAASQLTVATLLLALTAPVTARGPITLTAAGTDTLYADVRSKTLYELASAASEKASQETGAAKRAAAREAIKPWGERLRDRVVDEVKGAD